jgi:hypothetical protein
MLQKGLLLCEFGAKAAGRAAERAAAMAAVGGELVVGAVRREKSMQGRCSSPRRWPRSIPVRVSNAMLSV